MNSKSRKISFIRIKNDIRKGKIKLTGSVKMSLSVDLDEYEIKQIAYEQWQKTKRLWKLKFDYSNIEVSIGSDTDDFIRQLKTIRIKYIK